MLLTKRFEDALGYACRLHNHQVRKASGVPYVAHLLGVTSIALEYGADEDQAIAALLHDAVEDQGGLERLEEIRRLFGESVSAIVQGCSDSFTQPKPPWRQRKEEYLLHLRTTSPEIRLVSCADKLYNARSILKDLRKDGGGVWDRFRGGHEGSLWYYRSLLEIFKEIGPYDLADELERVLNQIEKFENEQF